MEELLLQQQLVLLTVHAQLHLSHKYNLYYLINRNPYLLSFNNGENQTNLRKNDILKMRLSYPTNEAEVEFVLNRLDEQINLINEFIENKEQTIRECDALKQSILHQAFSGKL